MSESSPVRESLFLYVASAMVAIVVISVFGVLVFRRLGQDEAVRDAKDQTRASAFWAIDPALLDQVLADDKVALGKLDRLVRTRILKNSSVVRVKIWAPNGRIIYSDEARLIGARYTIPPDERDEFMSSNIEAEVSDLSKPENRFERRFGKLLEVYAGLVTPSGRHVRYEEYFRSSFISARGQRIFNEFGYIALAALILLALIQLPLAWQLAKGVERGQRDRERLLQRAVEASDVERRRIARDLHDWVVQDLAAVSFSLSAAAEGAPPPYDAELREAAAETRHGIGQLRTLLVDIYPPELHRAGLEAALTDVLAAASARGLDTALEVDPDVAALGRDTEALFFRVAQEAIRNTVKHSGAEHLSVSVRAVDGRARLEVDDDGCGFDATSAGGEGHFGLRAVEELVHEAGGELLVDSTVGEGSHVSVEVDA